MALFPHCLRRFSDSYRSNVEAPPCMGGPALEYLVLVYKTPKYNEQALSLFYCVIHVVTCLPLENPLSCLSPRT
jgi:hypothetical protein